MSHARCSSSVSSVSPIAPAPLVSVLLPVRDGADTLDAALESLASQTLRQHEVIVVDDGSQDDTAELVEAWSRRDPRVRLQRQPPQGIVSALNHAAEQARAPLLARMDADDICLPARLERQRRWLERRADLVAVGSLVESFGAGADSDGWARYLGWLNGRRTADQIARDLLVESPLAHPSVMLRAEALREVGGYRDFDGPEDYELWLRLARAGGRFAKVPAMLLRWRDHASRLTRTDGRYRPEAFLACKLDHLLAGPLRATERPVVIWGAGRDGGRFGRALIARGVQLAAFIDIDPRRIGNTRHGAPVIAVDDLTRLAARRQQRPLILIVVGVAGARRLIRQRLSQRGYVELEDYFCCA
jgi:GT2 family glycosyltransferase